MKKLITAVGIIFVLAGCQKATTPTEQTQLKTAGNKEIKIETPLENEVITSPLAIKGEVKGYWMFEATFDVYLQDDEGNELGYAPATTAANWMTEDFIPFETTLTFSAGEAKEGKLIFLQYDASGPDEGPEPRSFEMPVRFE